MRKLFVLAMVLVMAAACDRADYDDGLACGAYDVTVEFSADTPDVMRAVLNGDGVDLTLVPAASGAKYQGVLNDTTVVLWERGGEWTLMLDDDTIIECGAK